MDDILKPFVHWAQTENKIYLKVDLTNVKVNNSFLIISIIDVNILPISLTKFLLGC